MYNFFVLKRGETMESKNFNDLCSNPTDPLEQYQLGMCYLEGNGVGCDYGKAVEWLEKAAQGGVAEALFQLGKCYWEGKGVEADKFTACQYFMRGEEESDAETQRQFEEDIRTAVLWLKKAVELGMPKAQYITGMECLKKKNLENAAYWFGKAAEQGMAEAQYQVGLLIEQAIEGSLDRAVDWYKKAAKQGCVEAKYRLSDLYFSDRIRYVNYIQVEKIFKYLKETAELGYARSQYHLGKCYAAGRNVERDSNAAFRWYEKAAEQGEAEAQYAMGLCYETGVGTQKNIEKAIEWYKKASEQKYLDAIKRIIGICSSGDDLLEAIERLKGLTDEGNTDAQYFLGKCYAEGKGVEADPKEAFGWYEKAARKGSVNAQFSLGVCYEIGNIVDKNIRKATIWYKIAAEQGNIEAQYRFGLLCLTTPSKDKLYTAPDREDAVHFLEDAARSGHAKSQCLLGKYYMYEARGVWGAWEKACELFLAACKKGVPEAEYQLALCYLEGKGVKADWETATRLFKHYLRSSKGIPPARETFIKTCFAAMEGSEEAQCQLYKLYTEGKGIVKNQRSAFRWLSRAAEQNNLQAQFALAKCYVQGVGITKNWEAAFKIYKRLAEKGHAKAQRFLGICYKNGYGVQKDEKKWEEWTQKAADQGDEKAKADLLAEQQRLEWRKGPLFGSSGDLDWMLDQTELK